MRSKRLERERAIDLRRRGLSYSEIRKHVPVAKSSLSLWLRSVGLLEWQQERLSKRKLAAARMGGRKVHERRVERTKQTVEQAAGEGQQYLQAKDVHWLTGVVFYWAEGSKPKPWNHAEQFGFTNMDVTTILIMRDWLERYCAVRPTDITYDLYIHAGANVVGTQEFWLRNLGIEPDRLRTYFKRNNPSPRRRNVGRDYHGIMRMRVKRSTGLNHRVSGWIQAVTRYCGVV